MLRSAIHIITTIAVLVVLSGAAAAQTPLVYIDPDSTYIGHNTVVTLAVKVSAEMTSLMGYNIAVTFDPSVLQLQNVNEGSLPLTSGFDTFFYWLNPTSTDSVHVNGAILGHTVDGPGTLFTLTFLAWSPLHTATTDLVIATSVIRDGVNHNITHTVEHGWVLVEPPVAARLATWGEVKALYRE
jgi:hypothetical protein